MKISNFVYLFIVFSLFINFSFSTSLYKEDSASSAECDVCEFVLEFSEKYIADNKTEQDIIKDLQDVCKVLPDTDTCDLVVNNYAVLIVRLLINNESPSTICSMIELCPKSETIQQVTLDSSDSSSPFCIACEFAMEFAVNYLAQNKTEQDIIKDLQKACKVLPGTETCDLIVNNYAALIVKLLINNESPSAICSMLELCPKSKSSLPLVSELNECSICKLVTSEFEDYFTENKTQGQVISYLTKECSIFSSQNWVDTCVNLVETYVPILFTMLENDESPSVLCSQIDLCSSSSSSSPSSTSEPQDIILDLGNEVECPLCTYIASYAEELLASNSTELDIEKLVQKFCKKLDSKYSGMCSAMVQNYIPDIITMIENNFTPSQICTKFNFCPAPTNSPQSIIITPPQIELGNQVECPLCVYIASYAEQLLAANSTELDIEKLVQKLCKKLDSKYSGMCSAMVQNYIPDIITMIENNFTPSQICTKFNFCPAPTNSPQSIDNKPSTSLPRFDLNSEIECPLCVYIANYTEELLESNKTEQEIISLIQKECNRLPAKYATMCSAMALNYVPEIITMIENNWTADQICEKIKLCIAPSKEEEPVQDVSKSCQVCTVLGNYAYQMFIKNATQDETYNNLFSCCKGFPKSWDYPCYDIMQRDGHELVGDIYKGYSSTNTCNNIGYCGSSSSSNNSGSSSGSLSGFSSGFSSGSSGFLMKFN